MWKLQIEEWAETAFGHLESSRQLATNHHPSSHTATLSVVAHSRLWNCYREGLETPGEVKLYVEEHISTEP